MKFVVTVLYDETQKNYLEPRFDVSDNNAIRAFCSRVSEAKAHQSGLFFTHPEDFSLWRIGEFDSESGHIEVCHPERLYKGCDV